MDWDNLRFFLELARTGRLTDAGKRLGVDHTTVSRRIHALENDMGVTLFARNGSGMTLTEQGREQLAHAEAMERAALAFGGQHTDLAEQLSGTVRIGVTEGFGTEILAECLGHFALRHPGLTIDLIAVSKIVNISRREADIVLALERPSKGPFVITQLCHYALYLYASREYSRAHGTVRHADELKHHKFIGYVDDLIFSHELQYLGELGIPLSFSLRSTSVVAQRNAAAAGCGIAVLPAFLAEREPRLQRVLPDSIGFRRTFWMSMPLEIKHLARTRACWDFLKTVVAEKAGVLVPAA